VPEEAPIAALTADQQALFEKGRTVYTTYCAACHQPTGIGQEGLAPPLVDSEWVLGPPERIAGILLHGLSGPITVNGVKFQLDMPPLPGLTDEDIAAVSTYVRREWEHTALPLPVETVSQVRELTRARSIAWTGPELEKFRLSQAAPKTTEAPGEPVESNAAP
jgi:mono/diheme cytochrome c family protein